MTETSRKTRLFSLRPWHEEIGDAQIEWRGKVQALPEGEAYYFREGDAQQQNLIRRVT